MLAHLIPLYLATTLALFGVEGSSTLNPLPDGKEINENPLNLLEPVNFNENIAQKIQYLEMQRQLQETLIENLEHRITMINNDYESRQNLLLASINLLVEEKHDDIFDQIKSNDHCECTGRTGRPGVIGPKGDMGYPGPRGDRERKYIPKGEKGDKGFPGIDYRI